MKRTRSVLFIILIISLLLSACTPAVQPGACNGEHIDTDGNLCCDTCGEPIPAPPCNGEHTDANDDLLCDGCGTTLEWEDPFLPVIRFAISSDIHVRSASNDYGSKDKLMNFITSAYIYSQSYKSYDELDGIFVVGDLTQDGKTAEYSIATQAFNNMVSNDTVVGVTLGNHEFHAYGSGDERYNEQNIGYSKDRFTATLGYESVNWHVVINGYHFISIGNDYYETRKYFSDETIEWLRGEIEIAIADDASADKPIFVMNHEGPYSTVRGFTGGDPKLTELLQNYPRVVDFSGHTHRSILDPQSIWQDGFTAIGTGGLAYLGYNMAGHPTYNNSAVVAIDDEGDYIGSGNTAARTGAMYYIVEVDASNNIRLRIYDLLTDSIYGEPIVFKVGKDEPEVFTPDREERSVAPIFPENAVIEVTSTDYNYPTIRFSTPTGGDLTQYYRIELTKDGESEASVVFYRLGGMHNAAKNIKYATTPIRGHESGSYTIKIYAVNCWGKESLPITGAITIDEKTMTPDILNTVFNDDGSATSGDDTLLKRGTPTVSYNEEIGMNVATFDGTSGYRFNGISDYYGRIVHSLTIEAYFKAGETDATLGIGSNSQSAGFGLFRTKDGAVRFNIRFNNGVSKYLYVYTENGTAPIGEWVHAVVSYSNTGGIRIYINGEAMTLYDEDGNEVGDVVSCSGRLFQAPRTTSTMALIVGGDISSSGGVETGFIGDIAVYNLYSRALTADEVSELYSAYDNEIK